MSKLFGIYQDLSLDTDILYDNKEAYLLLHQEKIDNSLKSFVSFYSSKSLIPTLTFTRLSKGYVAHRLHQEILVKMSREV